MKKNHAEAVLPHLVVRCLLAVALVAASIIALPVQASAAGETLEVALAQVDGTGPFDTTDDPGKDSSASNGIIRTNDNVTYQVEVRVLDANADNVTFTLPFPQGIELDAIPPYCEAGSTLTPTSLPDPAIPTLVTSWQALPTQTLVCNAGARTAFSTFTYPVVAKVRGEVPNGTTLDPAAASVVSDDVTIAATSNAVDLTVSARAQFDISKNSSSETENAGYFSNSGLQLCSDGSGRTCQRYNFPILISAPQGGKGTSPAQSPVTFIDDLSPGSFYGSAVLTDPDYIAAGAGAANKYGPILQACRRWTWASPDQSLAVGTTTNAVRDSGTTTCTQPGGPGNPVTISIANMDSTAHTTPTEASRPVGRILPINRGYVYSGAITVDIPIEAVIDLGIQNAEGNRWQINWRNELLDFEPTGFDGVVNDPAAQDAFNDYRASSYVATTSGSFNKHFVGVGDAPGNATPVEFAPGFAVFEGPAGSTGPNAGDGQVFPGQNTLSMLRFVARNGSTGQDVSFIGCDGWDPTLLQLDKKSYPASSIANGQRLPSNGEAVWVHGLSLDGYATPGSATPVVPALNVEYGNGAAGPGLTCNDADSPGGWHADPADVPGNDPVEAANGVYTGVSRVRVHVILPPHATGSGTRGWVAIGLRSTPGLATNTIIPNWATSMIQVGNIDMPDMLADPTAWSLSDYDPATNLGSRGDRLFAGGAVARLAKEVKSPGTGNWVTTTPAVSGGQAVEYRIRPTLTAGVDFPITLPLRVEDCLPAGQSFSSSTVAPSIVQDGAPADADLACAVGRTYIRWDLPAEQINEAIDPIEYTVQISPVATSGVKTNEALISTPSDPSAASERSDTAAVQVTQPAGIELDKVALTPIVEVNRLGETNEDPLRWRLDFANLDTNPGPTDPDIIDVLPANGLGNTFFDGTLEFDSATVNVGGATTQILYTSEPAANINLDGVDPSNDAATGTTIWCDAPSAGAVIYGAGVAADCPTQPSQVTGLRIIRPGAFGPGAVVSVEIEMTPSDNRVGNVYDNASAARGVGLFLPVGPVHALEIVTDSSIGDRVWNDLNGNGLQDPFEPNLDGIAVQLTGTDSDGNPVSEATVTAGGGTYLFDGLQSGDYEVTFSLPPATGPSAAPVFTFQSTGTDGTIDSDGDPATGSASISLNANADADTIDQGILYPDPSVTIVKSLEGDDANTSPGIAVPIGSTIDVTFEVTNDGNLTLSPVTVTDSVLAPGDISCPLATLAPTESMTCTATVAAPALDTIHTNTATVTATPLPLPDGSTLSDAIDTDSAFAESIWAEISGNVYHDQSNDGTFDSDETGIELVTITLLDAAGVVVATTTTDTDGFWEFRGLEPGTYTVVESQPVSHLDGTDTSGTFSGTAAQDDRIIDIVVAANDRATDNNFGELLPASASGAVVDNFGDPIEGVVITLIGTDDLGAPVTLTVTTGPDGLWSFDGLRPGTYVVTETQPEGYGDGDELESTSATGTSTTTQNDEFTIELESGDDSTDNIFTDNFGSIAGTVFHDHNNDGIQDPGDLGIPGVAVALTDSTGTLIAILTTDSDGNYLFDHLLEGDYQLIETTPTTFEDGTDTLGDLGGDDSVNDQFLISLPAGHEAVDYDFAEIGTSITGTIWVDDNIDQSIDGNEPGRVAGVTVNLRDANGDVVATTTTDAAGFYVFDDLFPGDYTVEILPPAGYGLTTGTSTDVELAIGGVSGIDFGVNLGAISGTIWSDADGDGIQDPDEVGVPNAAVILLDSNGDEIGLTATALDGSYIFNGLPIGDYSIKVVPGPNQSLTLPEQGTDDTLDSDVDWVTGTSGVITIACPDAGCSTPSSPLGVIPHNDAGIVANTVDLQLAKSTTTTGDIEIGDQITWVIDVSNVGTTAAASVRVLDELPDSLAFVSAAGTGWTCAAAATENSFTCELDDVLRAGENAAPILVLTSIESRPDDGSIVNRAGVSTTTAGIIEDRIIDNTDDSEISFAEPPIQTPSTTVAPTTSPSTTPPSTTTPPTTPTRIAFTGSDSIPLAASGIALVMIGALFIVGSRRRRR